MRIISGVLRGRKLFAPPGQTVRPTSDKVKEALFNILGDRIEEATFLDLYAGTGSVGIEALSRGAKEVTFVEFHQKSLQYLKKNLTACSIRERGRIFEGTASDFLKKRGRLSFDFIFIDPPYESQEIEKTLPTLAAGDMITENGIVIIEHFHKKQLPEMSGRLKLQRHYKYGETVLSFYGKE